MSEGSNGMYVVTNKGIVYNFEGANGNLQRYEYFQSTHHS